MPMYSRPATLYCGGLRSLIEWSVVRGGIIRWKGLIVKRALRTQWLLLAVLVFFGVPARLYQVQWNVTPTAALALFAGYLFTERKLAYAVPLAILAVSNFFLPSHHSAGEMLAVYGSFLIPVALGGLVRRRFTLARVACCTLASSVLFFLITNFAVWIYRRGDAYADSWAGLLACYEAGLLFFRWMLAGDLFYAAVIFGSYALAISTVGRRVIRVPLPRDDR
jgi:hypothetical protein